MIFAVRIEATNADPRLVALTFESGFAASPCTPFRLQHLDARKNERGRFIETSLRRRPPANCANSEFVGMAEPLETAIHSRFDSCPGSLTAPPSSVVRVARGPSHELETDFACFSNHSSRLVRRNGVPRTGGTRSTSKNELSQRARSNGFISRTSQRLSAIVDSVYRSAIVVIPLDDVSGPRRQTEFDALRSCDGSIA